MTPCDHLPTIHPENTPKARTRRPGLTCQRGDDFAFRIDPPLRPGLSA
jgi:hypothetical protein